MDVKISLEVPSDRAAAVDIRHALENVRGYFTPTSFDDMQLLVSELVTNSSRHAGLEPGSMIGVVIRSAEDGAHIEVTDHGKGFERDTDPPSSGIDATGGWGLRLVQSLAERW